MITQSWVTWSCITEQLCRVSAILLVPNYENKERRKSYGRVFFHPITHLSHSKNPKPSDPKWAKSSCVSILLLERFQGDWKKSKDHVFGTWRKLYPFTHPAGQSWDTSAWRGRFSGGKNTHNLYSTYQSEPWIVTDWQLIIFILTIKPNICFCCNR